jgi:hypothetical protein
MALQDSPVTAVLDEIERILDEEREGLRRLDREVIDRCASRKTSLENTLRAVLTHAKPGELQRARMERLKAAALVNQMLIAQARSCLKSILQVAGGHGPSEPPPALATATARTEAPQRRLLVQG